jgi:hypothetical protein
LVANGSPTANCGAGHTATLYEGDKLIIFGGENEHRKFLSDIVIFDLKTAYWTQPPVRGPIPKGRARHAAALYGDKLFIVGGLMGDNCVLDDVCYLDLKTFTWSRSWTFVRRFDHAAWVWGGKLWVFGGLGQDMSRDGEIWWLDLKTHPAFDAPSTSGHEFDMHRARDEPRQGPIPPFAPHVARIAGSGGAGGAGGRSASPAGAAQANASSSSSSSFATRPSHASLAPGIASLNFVSSADYPPQASGTHFYAYSSRMLLDFVTPASTIRSADCGIAALDLAALRWERLTDAGGGASGDEVFCRGYRWHYCVVDGDGTRVWLLGCPTDLPSGPVGGSVEEESLCDVLAIDLRRFGLVGNAHTAAGAGGGGGGGDAGAVDVLRSHGDAYVCRLGLDLADVFNQPPGDGSGTDFIITADPDDYYDATPPPAAEGSVTMAASTATSTTAAAREMSPLSSLSSSTVVADTAELKSPPPIHVHLLILQARWGHFRRVYASRMLEFQTRRMHIPEPYSVVLAFLYYLYTDSIAAPPPGLNSGSGSGSSSGNGNGNGNGSTTTSGGGGGGELHAGHVAGLLVMANLYDMPGLRLLCMSRLARSLDVTHAAVVWERADTAGEDWLRRRAARFCLRHWGRVVRTPAFRRLGRHALGQLCEEVDADGRVLNGEELDAVDDAVAAAAAAASGGGGAGGVWGGHGVGGVGGGAGISAWGRNSPARYPVSGANGRPSPLPEEDVGEGVGEDDAEMDIT